MPNSLMRERVDVDRYYAMELEGEFALEVRTELIDGEIIHMPPIGCSHAAVVNALARSFNLALGSEALVSIQAPVRLDRFSEPQPDLMLLAPREDSYRKAHPCASDVLLLVEVSDSSLRYDANTKLSLFAHHGIREVWIVDIQGLQLRLFRSPRDGRYTQTSSVSETGIVSPLLLPGVAVDLKDLFGA